MTNLQHFQGNIYDMFTSCVISSKFFVTFSRHTLKCDENFHSRMCRRKYNCSLLCHLNTLRIKGICMHVLVTSINTIFQSLMLKLICHIVHFKMKVHFSLIFERFLINMVMCLTLHALLINENDCFIRTLLGMELQ